MSDYFDAEQFAQKIIEDCGMGNSPHGLVEELKDAIMLRLSDRIIDTVTSSMNEQDVILMDNILKKNPDMDEFEALMIVAEQIPNLDKKMEKAILDLYEELVYTSYRITDAVALREQREKEQAQTV